MGQKKKLLSKYYDEIAQDSGRYCFGVDDTLKGLDLGAVETLICWENLAVERYRLKNGAGDEQVKYLTPEQAKDNKHFREPEAEGGGELEVIEKVQLLEWFATNYKDFGQFWRSSQIARRRALSSVVASVASAGSCGTRWSSHKTTTLTSMISTWMRRRKHSF